MLVSYIISGVTVAVSGDVDLGWVKAPSGTPQDLKIKSISAAIVGNITATDPPTTFSVVRYTTDGTGATTPVGVKMDPLASASVVGTAKGGAFSGAPTDGGVMDAATLPTGQTFFQLYNGAMTIKSGERVGVRVNRNGQTGSATGTFTMIVFEGG